MHLFQKGLLYWREHGSRRMLQRVRRSLFSRQRYLLFQKSVTDAGPLPPHGDTHFQVLDPSHVGWLVGQWPPEFAYLGSSLESIIHARLAAEEIGVIGVDPDTRRELRYMAWASRHDFGLLTVLERPGGDKDRCIKNIWVSPKHRRKGLARAGGQYIEHQAAASGAETLWAFVKSENTPSIKLHQRLGYAQSGVVTFAESLTLKRASIVQNGKRRRLALTHAKSAVD